MTVKRGEIWLADLNPTRGHEQAGQRPCLVMPMGTTWYFLGSSPRRTEAAETSECLLQALA